MERLTRRNSHGSVIVNYTKIERKECIGNSDVIVALAINLAEYEDAEEQGLLLKLPCSIGTPVYYKGTIPCKECPHGEDKPFDDQWKDECGEPLAIYCEEECPPAVRSTPFSLHMLEDDGTLDKYWKLNKEDIKI